MAWEEDLRPMSSHSTKRYFIPNWGIILSVIPDATYGVVDAKVVKGERNGKLLHQLFCHVCNLHYFCI